MNSWVDISSSDLFSRRGICIVAKDNFIYLLGGFCLRNWHTEISNNADKYDLSTNTRDKVADLRKPRKEAYGAAAYGKIFIAGGTLDQVQGIERSCEVYNETTNEWHFIAMIATPVRVFSSPNWMCADGKLYSFNAYFNSRIRNESIIQCYDPDNNLWKEVTQMPLEMSGREYYFLNCYCSMPVLKAHDLLNDQTSTTSPDKVGKKKCAII